MLRWSWFSLVLKFCLFACGLVLAVQAGTVRADEGPIRVATLQWAPYTDQQLPGQGLAVEVLRAIFAEAGLDVEVHFTSWSRALDEAASGVYDAVFPAYYSKQRAQRYLLSEPLGHSPVGFVRLRGTPIEFVGLDQLKSYRIGIVRGYVNSRDFDQAEELFKVESYDDRSNLRLLLAGRLDLAVIDHRVSAYLMRTEFPGRRADLRYLTPLLSQHPLHVAFGRWSEQSPELLRRFNEGLASLRASGRLEQYWTGAGSGP